jgi:hypothetical protein
LRPYGTGQSILDEEKEVDNNLDDAAETIRLQEMLDEDDAAAGVVVNRVELIATPAAAMAAAAAAADDEDDEVGRCRLTAG